jgi:CDP-diacylglycerol--glycerol-3-phosphate 3-phosphatidyltransferase
VARVLTVPNVLTFFRILLVPLLVVVLLTKFEGKALVALGVFLLASLTDFLDGFIARRRQQVSRLGKLLDPAADKILVMAALISLIELDVAPAWMVMVILAREFLISAFRSLAAGEGIVMSASILGKSKTALQVVAISLLIIYEHLGEFGKLAPISLWLAMIATLVSGLEYLVRYGPAVVNGPEA